MKEAYKTKVKDYLDGIENSNEVIKQMLEGKRPSNQKDAISMTIKIERLLELTRNLIG
jgi:hypothetical protein